MTKTLDTNTAFFAWLKREVRNIKLDSSYPSELIAASLLKQLIADSEKGDYPQLWDALESTGHEKYTSETFLEAAKLIMQ